MIFEDACILKIEVLCLFSVQPLIVTINYFISSIVMYNTQSSKILTEGDSHF